MRAELISTSGKGLMEESELGSTSGRGREGIGAESEERTWTGAGKRWNVREPDGARKEARAGRRQTMGEHCDSEIL